MLKLPAPLSKNFLRLVLGLALLCLAACAPPAFDISPLLLSPLDTPTPRPEATPTKDRRQFVTIGPTATPRPPTPRPTPTPTPFPAFPAEAVQPTGWPPLPANLYFLRNGSLWLWPQAGGELEQVVAAPQGDGSSSTGDSRPLGVRSFALSSDGRYVVYDFWDVDAAKPPSLIVLDRKKEKHTVIPNNLPSTIETDWPPWFAITPDGRYVVFIAWGTRPTSDAKGQEGRRVTGASLTSKLAGKIFAVEVQHPRRKFALGYCASHSDSEYEKNCQGLALAPDGRQVSFTDGRGVWVAAMPKGAARLLVEDTFPKEFCGAFSAREWSPDSRRMLMHVGCYEGGYHAVLELPKPGKARTARWQQIPDTGFYVGARVDLAWSEAGKSLLLSRLNLVDGQAFVTRLAASDPKQATMVLSSAWPGDFWPISPHDLPDGRIAFANQQCIDGPGQSSGIYALTEVDSAPSWVASLPTLSCMAANGFPDPYARVHWSGNGAAFIYFAWGDDWISRPVLVGASSDGAIWDVREALADASDLRWLP